jgi:outer membrane receptor protein involved in Fe transport
MAELALFRMMTRDEIVFDPDATLGPFGANVNAGRTRRAGAELSLDGRAGPRVTWFSRYTRTRAEFRSGDAAGKRVPLVPRDRLSVGVDALLPLGLAVRADALHVGEQVLDNDDTNAQRRLDGFTVVNVRGSWSPRGLRLPTLAGRGRSEGGVTLFVEVRNLFDEGYFTRGIWAYDFIANANAVFLTPAPGRRIFGGANWRF